MLISPDLRDIRDERKWHRHWIDKPGMGWFWCCCCKDRCACGLDGTKFGTTYHLTFGNTGVCSFLDGRTFAIQNTSGDCNSWTSALISSLCGLDRTTFVVRCDLANTYRLDIQNSAGCVGNSNFLASSVTCSPLSIVWNFNWIGTTCACCPSGTAITATMTT